MMIKQTHTCPKGCTLDSPNIEPTAGYSWWGWFLLGMGISSKVKRVRWQCRDCPRYLAETKDPEKCRQFENR